MATAGEGKWTAGGWSEHSLTRRIVCLLAQHRRMWPLGVAAQLLH